MERRRICAALLLLSVLTIILVGGNLSAQFWADNDFDENGTENDGTGITEPISLVSPSLASTFLDEEAGICIYTDVGQSLDLSIAKGVYKTIEKETPDYVVGSISLSGLPESDDVHCFVHMDGWIVVYYLDEEPASKIIDWNWYTGGVLSKTKLESGLLEMCLALGVAAGNPSYYHFQYRFANRLMIIIDTQEVTGTDSFTLRLPSDFTFYERSWSHHIGGFGDIQTAFGVLSAAQLSPDITHTIEVELYLSGSYTDHSHFRIDGETIHEKYVGTLDCSNAGIVLVYLEP